MGALARTAAVVCEHFRIIEIPFLDFDDPEESICMRYAKALVEHSSVPASAFRLVTGKIQLLCAMVKLVSSPDREPGWVNEYPYRTRQVRLGRKFKTHS